MADKQTQMQDIIKQLDTFFKQLPKLPANVREVLVKIAPILSLVFGILGIIAGIGALGVSPIALLGGLNASFMVLVSGVVAIASSVLMLMAYPKLQKRMYKGWELLLWSEAISAVSAVFALFGGFSIGSILGVLIGFYLLFQIKEYYK